MSRKLNRMPILPSLLAAVAGLSVMTVPAAAQVTYGESLSVTTDSEDARLTWGHADSIPTAIWQSQNGSLEDRLGGYENVFRGERLPENIWQIAQTQLELPGATNQPIFSSSSPPGSIPTAVWSVMRSQVGLPESGSNVFGSLEQILAAEQSPYDFSSVINRNNWGINSFSNQPLVPGSLSNGSSSVGSSPLPELGQAAQQAGSAISQTGQTVLEGIRQFRIPQLAALNPFRRMIEWTQNTPLARTMGVLGKRIRGVLGGSTFGFFTRNPVVKERDQANLFDQEIARMIAEPQLGEAGEQWLAGEAKDTLSVLEGGLQEANAAVQIAAAAQSLTSTQDVAKAVAQQGGQNAAVSAAVLQMQAQNQASLLQIQQLTSSAIQLSANNSEGIDEANRRERAERSNALRQSASEFIYVPDVFE